MSRWRGWGLCILLVVCLMFVNPLHVFAALSGGPAVSDDDGYGEPEAQKPENLKQLVKPEPEPPAELAQTDTVSSQDTLAAWIKQHSETGGTVYLDNHVTITQDMGIYGISGRIIIDTGIYGLVFNGGMLPSGDIFITGEGADVPVVDVQWVDNGFPNAPSWNNTLLQLNVTAIGREGRGGTALRISAADPKSFDMTTLSEQGVIRSNGEGAVGLWLAVPMEAWCYKVEVSGKNSLAVYAPGGANLYFCKLTAEGEGAVSAAGDELLLDSCAASPIPSGVRSISRRAMEESFSRLYVPLKQNQNMSNSFLRMLYTPTVSFIGEDGSVIALSLTIRWDIEAYYGIDPAALGKTMVFGTVDPALYGLGVLDNIAIKLMAEVRDSTLPCISQVVVRDLEETQFAILNLWHSYDPTDENVILWRSDDEGKTWQDATRAPDILWNNGSVNFTYDTLEQPVWFQLEVTGIGESNIAILDERDGVFMGGNGGDRTGTDRGGVKPPSGGTETGGSNQPGNGHDEKTTDSDDGQPDGGSDNTPGFDKGSNKEDSDLSDNSNSNPPKTNEASNGSHKDNVEVGISIDGESNAPIVTGIPADALPLDMKAEAIPARNPTSAALAGTVPAEEQTEATQIQPTAESEKDIVLVKEEETPVIEEAAISFDPEQSAPEPEASAKVLTFFFLSAAGLSSGTLLFFQLGRHVRWWRGKL